MSVTLPGDGSLVATATVNGAEQQIVQVSNFPATQAVTGSFFQATQPVSFTSTALTDTQLRAAPVPVSVLNGTALTDAQLRALPVPISGTVTANTGLAQGLTDAQLRASALPVSFTNTALTDAQIRLTPLPVSGAVSVSNFPTAQAVTGTFFPSTQPVSAASLPLPTGAATEATQVAINAKTPALGQANMVASVPVVIAGDQAVSVRGSELAQSGNLTVANQSVVLPFTGLSTGLVEITGNGVGTLIFEASADNGATFPSPINGVLAGGGADPSNTATLNGSYRLTPGGFTNIRVRCLSYTSGTFTVNLRGSSTQGGTFINQVAPVNVRSLPTTRATGNVTTQNLVPAGAATVGSAVAVSLAGAGGLGIQVAGVYSGALNVQVTCDDVNWVTLGGQPLLNAATGVFSTTVASAATGIFDVEVSGYSQARVTGLAAMTGTATVTLIATPAAPMVALNAPVTVASGTVAISSGTITVGSITAGTNAIGDVGMQVRPSASGANNTAKVAAAAGTNATLIKATQGRISGWSLVNTTAAVKVVRLYNLTVAPTVGTSVPAYSIVLPPNDRSEISLPAGIGHLTGISYAITGAIPDLDATAVVANDVIGMIFWA